MFRRTSMPMSQGTSHPEEPVTTLAPVVRTDLGANRSRSVPSESWYHTLHPIADSLTVNPLDLIDRAQSTNPQFASNLLASPVPSSNTSTISPKPLNLSPGDTERPFSRSTGRPEQEPYDSTGYNSEAEAGNLYEVVADGDGETGKRLTTLYVDSEDHPAYKKLETRIYQSHNDGDRWEACKVFHEEYRTLKRPILELGGEIEKQRRKLEESQAARNDKESSLDALVLLGTSIMLSECDLFSQVQRSYREGRRKRPRNPDSANQCDVQTAGEDWSDFLDDHSNASRELRQCEKALNYIGATWGKDKIRYYGWATKTSTVCRQLQAAAKAVPIWEEVGIKLNRLRNYRDRNAGTPITGGKSSISWKDFECLSKWKGHGDFQMPLMKRRRDADRILPFKPLATSEFNSERLGFDKYGILVVKTITPSEMAVKTYPAPPWGMAQGPVVHTEDDLNLRLSDTSATSIRESARVAARHPISYTDQLASTGKPFSHSARRGPSREKYRGAFASKCESESSNSSQGSELPNPRNRALITAKPAQSGQNQPIITPEAFYADFAHNKNFRTLALEDLNDIPDEKSWGSESSKACRYYLSNSSCPIVDPKIGPIDAHFSTTIEATRLVENATPEVPIFTRCNNSGTWKANLRPIVDYLTQPENLETIKVHVQKYSLHTKKDSYVQVSPWDLIRHFVRDDHGTDGFEPWNALELKNYLRHRHVPEFLTNSNCTLLREMREYMEKTGSDSKGKVKKRAKLQGKDPQHFALIADGGMNTYPHSDSHGYSTFLTVQEGELIFGWLSHPDDDTWDKWAEDPRHFRDGRWCYLVMRPRDSVYLPPGMPHYVIRKRGTQTFILGGHILQWSSLQNWTSLLRKQIDNPATTNEDMALPTVQRYVEVAGALVNSAIESKGDRLEYLGGIQQAERTLEGLKDLRKTIEEQAGNTMP